MTIDAITLFFWAAVYAACMFGLAHATERDLLPKRLINHPAIYVLSLGVAISTWSFYTSISTAGLRGYGYLAYYIGYSGAFLFAPVILEPIMHITRTYQLSSIADIFAFRFRSPLAGTLTTILLVICVLPLLALQLIAISSAYAVVVPEGNPELLALVFCLVVILFTLIYGASDRSGRDKHEGVVTAMAFEGLVKVLILLVAGLFAVYAVFGGFNNLDQWLSTATPAETRLELPFLGNSTNLVILLFFTAAITMPNMFHMTFRENSNPANLRIASWGVPLLLLTAAVPALPLMWAATHLESQAPLDFSALAIGLMQDAPWLTVLVFVGGLAAASGMSVIGAMALSNMCLNHLLLRIQKPEARTNLYRWLQLRRRLMITAIILAGYLCFVVTGRDDNFTDLAYITFVANVQLLPGLIALLYWPKGNRKGFIAGITCGALVWLLIGLLPFFTPLPPPPITDAGNGQIDWNMVAVLSLACNMLVLLFTSRLTTTSDEERSAGEMCAMENLRRPRRIGLIVKNPREFIDRLSVPLGKATAKREVLQALKDLGIDENETRPYTIQQLRSQIEANLSGLLGPTIAHQIIDHFLPYEMVSEHTTLDVSFIESRLEAYPGNLSGVAADLDNLRRYHRQILLNLPVGACSVANNSEISLWNSAMEKITEVPASFIVGSYPTHLPQPWRALFLDFIEDSHSTHIHKKSILFDGKQRWVSLHKAFIEPAAGAQGQHDGVVIVVEDLTDTELLEAELAHSERLASIGRLAAGVAHEIGNPITGIACLAQNIRDETPDPELRHMAEQIIEQTHRTSRIVQSLVRFSHSGATQGERFETNTPVSVRECADEAIQLISLNDKSRDIEFINDCGPEICVRGDKQRVLQIFVNLLSNARDASKPGSRVSVTNSINNDQVSIMIVDEGDGIPTEIQDRIFEPFFTTKEPGKGTGLGLALVYSIAEDLGGSVRVESPADTVSKKGTRVIVTFPCYHEDPVRQAEPA